MEWSRRRIDAVRMFRPAPGEQEKFFRCNATEILLRGGNRSGKTVCTATRFAAIARDMPITLKDGTQIDARLPHQRKRPLVMWVVGYDLKHIGQTIYRVLFRPGLYKIIQDPDSGLWRAFDPTLEYDAANEHKAKPAPPLIPQSEIDTEQGTGGFTWENKGEKQFSAVYLKNGTIIYAFSSMGEVKAGDPVDVIWIDEKIKYPQHYPEWQARLSDRRGRLLWSSWPARDNAALRQISRRAKHAAENPGSDDDVREFQLRFSSNPFISEDQKRKRIAGWSEDERTARDLGDFAVDSLKMYHTFSPEIHCAFGPDPTFDDKLAAKLRSTGGQPPADWTRYLVLDPGTSHPAVLLAAVPPPEVYGHFVVPYQEVYTPRLDADALAKVILDATQGQVFEAFIVDPRAARQTPMGFSGTVGMNYSRAFRERRLSCRISGSAFTPGSDDVLARIALLRAWMVIQSDGRTKLRIVADACPNLCRQLVEYEKKERDGIVLEEPADKQRIDVAQCLEYLASRRPQYVARPEQTASQDSPAMRAWKKLQERDRGGQRQPIRCGPEAATSYRSGA